MFVKLSLSLIFMIFLVAFSINYLFFFCTAFVFFTIADIGREFDYLA